MTPEQEALGRRAVACPGWMWMRGCPWERPPSGAPDDGGDKGEADWKHDPPAGALPDLSEPAGVGCLVALAREALGEPEAYVAKYWLGWFIHRPDDDEDDPGEGLLDNGLWAKDTSTGGPSFLRGPSEPAVWVAALEAAGRNQREPDAPVSGGRSGASRAV